MISARLLIAFQRKRARLSLIGRATSIRPRIVMPGKLVPWREQPVAADLTTSTVLWCDY